MHTVPESASKLAAEIIQHKSEFGPVEVALFPPFTSLAAVREIVGKSKIRLGGQNMHFESEGAFTGEVSGTMLKASGCSMVILGHSERRLYFGETDQLINLKLEKALEGELIPIFCLGEKLPERQNGKTFEVLERQLAAGLGGLRFDEKQLVIAYEPVWAIGTGVNATPEQAAEAHRFLREKLSTLVGPPVAEKLRILYGGSVNAGVAGALFAEEEIDGALVGGASLKAAEFVEIVKKAK
ncbi:MAG: triose-phosphate isomerase [candidate division Zixibacteria bacterium]|nr:triose-phosphate isomerase [candidate division Zixibacteria bacterium]